MKPLLHPWIQLEEFQSTLKQIAYNVADYGIDRFKPNPDSPIDYIRFSNLVHEGWKLAQDQVAEQIFLLAKEDQAISDKRKEAGRRHQRQRVRYLKEAHLLLEKRRNRLRHAINAIVWTLFDNRHYILRRFDSGENTQNFGAESLGSALEYARDINKAPSKIAIACDLATCMDIGDVLVVDLAAETGKIQLVELKSGKTNEKCLEILSFYSESKCKRFLQLSLERLSGKEAQQLNRIIKQESRAASAMEVIENEVGTDPFTGEPIRFSTKEYKVGVYYDQIIEMASKLESGKEWAIGVVKECLFLGLYSNHEMAMPAFNGWLRGVGVDGPALDYASVFSYSIARPTLSLDLPYEITSRLYTGEWRLLMCLDVGSWIRQVNSSLELTASLETKKKTRKQERYRSGDLFHHNDRAVKIAIDGQESYIGTGTTGKIFFDFYDPVEAIAPFADPS